MKELMVHVERIVRPVRAFASRKLRMRRELLIHLQAAVVEEGGPDDPGAFERSKQRLGEPTELTRTLQEAVPWIERVLFAKLPFPCAVERFEARSGKWWKLDYPMTMTQKAVLIVGATLLSTLQLMGLAMALPLDRAAAQRLPFERPMIWTLLNVGNLFLVMALSGVCARFIVATASSSKPLQSRAAKGYAAAIFCSPAVSMLLLFACVNRRPVTASELLRCFGAGFILLASQAAIGRLVGAMHRPYAEWLMLDVAG